MSNAVPPTGKWNQRSTARVPALAQNDTMFELLFERSADAIWLFDPQAGVFVDCNQAAVDLLQAGCKQQLLGMRPEELSPPHQPDGSRSRDRVAAVIDIAGRTGGHRFEWVARRFDGKQIPLEVVTTPIPADGGELHVVVSRDISERREAEAALRESQQVLASIADNISEAIYRSDPDHRLMFVNRAYLRLFGYGSLAELQALPREQLYADPTARAHLLELLLRDGAFSHQEVEYVRQDGSRFWGLSSGRIIRDAATGRAVFQVGAITDITARKKDEAEIRRLNQSLERRILERTAELASSEARFRAMVEHAPEAIVVFDGVTGRFLFGNDHACRLYGVTAEELTRLTPADVSPEVQPNGRSSAEFARENMGAALAGQTPVVEWVHRQPSGRLIPTEVRLLRLPAEGKNLLRASIIDSTERKRAEQALRESEEKFRALFSASSQGVMLHDHLQYLEVNPAAARILGYESPEELVGKSPGQTSPPFQPGGESSAALAQRYITECLAKGSARFEWLGLTAQGKEIPLEVFLTRIQWSGRQVIQAFINDISKRKRAEAELRRTLEREKELGRLKGNFVSMVSHEFRTPLGIIQSSGEILRDYFERLDEGGRREQLDSILKNTRRMAEMMEEILVLSRLDAGKMEFKPAPTDIGSVIQRFVAEVLSAMDRRCPIHLRIARLPAQAQADERLLSHIFTNLLTNAVKYSEPGQAVHLAVEREQGDLVCAIQDRGIGIPAADQQWLFNAFQRGSNVGDRPGTGLGLVLVKRCVDLHRGTVSVKSKIGEGTTVIVRLPVFGADA